jgi:ABC-type polysaccharide/polyol phosphate export permease
MYNFAIQAYSTYKALFHWLNWPAYISNVFLRPIIQVIMFSLLGRFAVGQERAQALALGIIVYSMVSILLGGITQSYSNETRWGTLSFIYVSRTKRLENYLSRAVLHYPNALLAFICGLITVWFILDMGSASVNWMGFIIAVLVIAASITAFGQFMGILAVVAKEWMYIMATANGILLVFTGAIIPIAVFPSAFQEIARLLPMTNGLFAVREAFAGAPFAQIYENILRELLTGLVYYLFGALGFIVVERVAKRTGMLNLVN